MEMALVRSAGALVWPSMFHPQAATVPVFRMARPWKPPVAIATAFVSDGGTLVWPRELSPQATTWVAAWLEIADRRSPDKISPGRQPLNGATGLFNHVEPRIFIHSFPGICPLS